MTYDGVVVVTVSILFAELRFTIDLHGNLASTTAFNF